MTNPPVEPSSPDGHESGTPQYGQNAPQSGQPQYGQNAPQYGQQAPQYGQQPQYGQNAPQPGQQAPQYGQQPQYGQNAPQYGQNAPQYGQPQYGQQPPAYTNGPSPYGYPSEQPQQSATGQPQLLNTAFWLLVASGVVWVISLLLALGTLDNPAMRSTVEQQMAAGGADISYDSIKGAVVVSIIVFAVISAGLYALVALNVRKGRNWARILGTVLAALSLLSLFPLSLGTLAVVLGVAGIVILYMPAVAPYFKKQQPFANPYGQNPYGR